jgi:hypothetical protein
MEIHALAKMMYVRKLTAIVITPDTLNPKAKPAAAKYIFDNNRAQLQRFLRFATQKFPGASHINFYNRETGRFVGQVPL